MSERKTEGTTQTDKEAKPSHHVYLIKNVDGKAEFHKIGEVFPHRDGKGYNQHLAFYDWDINLLIRENN